MADVELLGVEDNTDGDIVTAPFGRPNPNTKIRWQLTLSEFHYLPYLVKIINYVPTGPSRVLQFRGVKLSTPHQDFGRTNTSDYTVDPLDARFVHVYSPSTLVECDWDANKMYAILFLSDEYTESQRTDPERTDLLASARGGPKWPQSAGGIAQLQSSLNTLQQSHATLISKKNALAQALQPCLNEISEPNRTAIQQLLNDLST